MDRRASGILLPPICLATDRGIGDFGPAAFAFVDFLKSAGQRYWQILPLNPTTPESSHNAYSNLSAYAGNHYLISPELLQRDGLLTSDDLATRPDYADGRIDYDLVAADRERLLHAAWNRFRTEGRSREQLDAFIDRNQEWLKPYALFVSIRRKHNAIPWRQWPIELRDRHPDAIEEARRELDDDIQREYFIQWLFFDQWRELKRYANDQGIFILGDIPIYVDGESAEVWSDPDCFQLDADKNPTAISGAPPDDFSADGQLWGHPCFNWARLQERGFDWWLRRIAHNVALFDSTRIDHFRGFAAYWSIPANIGKPSAGQWVEAPGRELLETIRSAFPTMPFFAEDLGVITPDVIELKNEFNLPGMAVLIFAFNGDRERHPYLPHNHEENCVVYTGTHDTNTARGWYETEANEHEKWCIADYLWREVRPDTVASDMINMAMHSKARTAIVPIQDWLDLGVEARVNRPWLPIDNYRWRLKPNALTDGLAKRIADVTAETKRVVH